MLAALFAAAALALSPQHQEWAKGPASWIMTPDEQRQWKQITTDDEAENFILLFWARRDPTPGTPVNEFKNDFDARVEFADEHFADRDSTGAVITRGAMSDRGRVLMVMGFPPNADAEFRARNDLHLKASQYTGRVPHTFGAKDVWKWEKEDAKKFGMPRVEIVFVEDAKAVYHRDPQRPDFMTAMPAALKNMIVSPDLKDVPDWAKGGGGAVVARKGEPGAHHLLLLKDPHALLNSETADPFAGVTAADVFTKQDDVGYALEYCGDKDPVKVAVSIRGTSEGKPVRIGGLPVKAHPDPIKTVPGCGLVRAAVSLSDLPLGPGSYSFAVRLDDGSQSYNLAQDFKIE